MWRRRNKKPVEGVAGPWAVAPGTDNKSGLPIMLRINTGYCDATTRSEFPVRIECALPLVNPRPDGLPTNEDQHDLRAAEDVLGGLLAAHAVLVAVVTGGDKREFLFHARAATPVPTFDRDANRAVGTHNVHVSAVTDREWREYDKLASYVTKTAAPPAPAPEPVVPIAAFAAVSDADRAVLEQLVANGADLSTPRNVRHCLYLHSAQVQADAAAAIVSHGWLVERRQPLPTHPNDWLILTEYRNIILDAEAVSAARATFEEIARRFGGEYDGWDASL
jgi:regulator of RNase E activity RraB